MPEVRPEVSLVVPLFEAAERVLALHGALTVERDRLPPYELVLVDDASTDSTWPRIRELARDDPAVVGVRLAENVGQTGALGAGFATAQGGIVVMMDDDLDTRPAEIVRFVDAIRDGAEFASGWRHGSRQPLRQLGSHLYNRRLRRWGLPFNDAGCGTNAMSGDLAQQLAAEGWGIRQHRFKPRVAQLTEAIVEVPFPVRPTSGSHHNVRTLAASWLDVELTFGRLTRGRFAAVAVAGPLAAALASTAVVAATPRWRFPAVLVAVGAASLGASALDVLVLRQRADRRDAARPPYSVAEVVGARVAG